MTNQEQEEEELMVVHTGWWRQSRNLVRFEWTPQLTEWLGDGNNWWREVASACWGGGRCLHEIMNKRKKKTTPYKGSARNGRGAGTWTNCASSPRTPNPPPSSSITLFAVRNILSFLLLSCVLFLVLFFSLLLSLLSVLLVEQISTVVIL